MVRRLDNFSKVYHYINTTLIEQSKQKGAERFCLKKKMRHLFCSLPLITKIVVVKYKLSTDFLSVRRQSPFLDTLDVPIYISRSTLCRTAF